MDGVSLQHLILKFAIEPACLGGMSNLLRTPQQRGQNVINIQRNEDIEQEIDIFFRYLVISIHKL